MTVIVETFAVAAVSGFIFWLIRFPLPWVLGPLAAMLLWKNVFNRRVYMPEVFRYGGLLIIGYVMGSSFTWETAVQIAAHLPFLTIITFGLVLFSILLAFFICKPLGISFTSAMLGSVPGGLYQMVLLSDELEDADITSVTYMQSIRLLSVVFFVPFFVIHGLTDEPVASLHAVASAPVAVFSLYSWFKLVLLLAAATAGAWAAKKVHFPLFQMLGPLLVIASLQVSGVEIIKMPGLLLIPAQMTIGIYIGQSFNKDSINNPFKKTLITLLSSLALILFAFLMAYYLFIFYDLDIITGFLSTAPGGTSEMAVTAIAVNADLSFVTAFQIFRLLFILLIVSPVLKLILPRISKNSSSSGK